MCVFVCFELIFFLLDFTGLHTHNIVEVLI